MLKALLLLLMNLALAVMATAQNLVPNGSFEDTVNCSTSTQCTLLKAEHWFNPNLATPDLFDCDLDRACGSPMGPGQGAAFMLSSDGDRHAGAYFWYGPNSSTAREYMMTRIPDGLLAGVAYEVSLWYTRRKPHQYAVDHIGLWVGHDSIFEATVGWLNVTPKVKLRDPYSMYLGNGDMWTQLVDTLVAAGGEQWMVIGNFDPADSVVGILADPSGIYQNCYYYIDDVTITPVGPTTVADLVAPLAWWNGSGLSMRWPVADGPVRFELFDSTGRLLHRSVTTFSSAKAEQITPVLASGVYLVEVQARGYRSVVRFVKEEGGF